MRKPINGVQVASAEDPLLEPRLWGTWKSDRRKSFENFRFPPNASPEAQKRFRSLFGKLVITWGRSKVSSRFAGKRMLGRFPVDQTATVERYRVLARDRDKVIVVMSRDPELAERSFGLLPSEFLTSIEFDGDGYWVSSSLCVLREYFRRVPTADPPARTRK